MSDYLTANRKKIKAIIGLGDLATGSIKRVFDQVGVKAGELPVVGWGNSLDTTDEVMNGYVNAAQWQDPQATSYLALSLALMATRRDPAGLQHHHRHALREGQGGDLRESSLRQITACIRGGPRLPRMSPLGLRLSSATREGKRSAVDNRPTHLRLIAKPEFGPLVLLLLELVVFWSFNHDFLSPLNISNLLAFTVELGLIALAMTLLMTSGEFDLSVGSLFGFTPVVMLDPVQPGRRVLAGRLPCGDGRGPRGRVGERLVRDPAENPLIPGDPGDAAGGPRLCPLRHGWVSPAHVEFRRPATRDDSRRRVLHRLVPGLHIVVLVQSPQPWSSATC